MPSVRQISLKRQRQMREYSKLRHEFLEGRQRCEFPGGCVNAATEIHHRRGRLGGLLLAVDTFEPLCHEHHAFLTEHPAIAYQMGMSERRIGEAG